MKISIKDSTDKLISEQSVDDLVCFINTNPSVNFYDGSGVLTNSKLEPLDWAVSTLLQAPIRLNASFNDLLKKNRQMWIACEAALEEIPNDIPLRSAAALRQKGNIESAFKAFMSPKGIKSSIAAKILHRKRPELIPVIDDFVFRVLTDSKKGCTLTPNRMTSIIFENFRQQLIKNERELSEVAKLLNPPIFLSPVRILDIAIWKHADEHRADYGLPVKRPEHSTQD